MARTIKDKINIEELSRLLLLRDNQYRTIHSYVKQGLIKPCNKNPQFQHALIFELKHIYDILGLKTTINEPLINANEAYKIINAPTPKSVAGYVRHFKLPYYKIKNSKGAQMYFLRSELEKAMEYKIEWATDFPNFIARNYFLRELIQLIFTSNKLIAGLQASEREIITAVLLENESLANYAKRLKTNDYNVRHSFMMACKKVFYGVKILESRLNHINSIEEENQKLKIEVKVLRDILKVKREKNNPDDKNSYLTDANDKLLI